MIRPDVRGKTPSVRGRLLSIVETMQGELGRPRGRVYFPVFDVLRVTIDVPTASFLLHGGLR